MIDVKLLRENPDLVRASQKARGESTSLVDEVLAADEIRRTAIVEFEALRAEQNALSKSVGAAKGDEKSALLERAKTLSTQVKEAESKKSATEEAFKKLALGISNLVDERAPIGGEADFKVIEEIGKPRNFDFEAKDHVELGKILGAIDVELITQSRWPRRLGLSRSSHPF
jgi:seryl-tRNA synthetase